MNTRSAISTSATSACTPAATATASKPIPSRSRRPGHLWRGLRAGRRRRQVARQGGGRRPGPCALRRQLHQCAPDPRLARQGNDGAGAGRARAGPVRVRHRRPCVASQQPVRLRRPQFVSPRRDLPCVGAAARPGRPRDAAVAADRHHQAPDGRVVQTTLWQPAKDLQGYVERAIDLPPDAQTGTWLLELRVDPASRAPDASWKFRSRNSCPSA